MQKHNVYVDKLTLNRPENIYKATLCLCFLSDIEDYEVLIGHLHDQELKYYNTLEFEKRIRSYLMGRFTAKQAVAALTGRENLTDILIQPGIFTQPVVVSGCQNIQVSITHCDDFGAALAFPEAHPLGIDIEKINPNNADVLEKHITGAEKEIMGSCPFSFYAGLTLLWTAKEALSKVLKTGLMTPFEVFEIDGIEVFDNHSISHYKNFAQYKVISFTIDRYMCSIVYPKKTRMQFDINPIKENFSFIEF
ncbi:MAG: 4'-phosphopantetheinyl transferase [Peptococcaceae bacterium BICA1-7]|nr:MAG: 4'-phosphopantetheinyl transferase [Peptococcaceae bacterium BICA1-7]HBV97550.1 4'-phosphopantetheinyl transferase [Desulfotomaculum sp.]